MSKITRREALVASAAVWVITGNGAAAAMTGAAAGKSGLDLAGMDRSVVPGDDFYRHMNGHWLAATEIPADQATWGEFGVLADRNLERTRAILEEAANRPRDATAKKLGDFYATLIDEAAIEAEGLKPVQPDIARIQTVSSPADLARALGRLSRDWPRQPFGTTMPLAPINAAVNADMKQPRRYLPVLAQGGLGVPDREYLLTDSPAMEKVRVAYRAHLVAMFRLAGLSDPEANAARAYALEVQIARAHRTREAQRNPKTSYNLLTAAELKANAPGLDWDAFLAEVGFAGESVIQVSDVGAVVAASALAGSAPLQDWRDYLVARTLDIFGPVGPKAVLAEWFAFTQGVLSGTPAQPPRWKQAATHADRSMGQATGEIYRAKYLPPSAQAQVEAMTREIIAAMGRRIRGLDWMTPQTKQRALTKLAAVRIEVGGQAKPVDYSALRIVRGDAYGNLLRAANFEYDRNLAKLGKPVDRGEWAMLPHTVNAQANPVLVKNMFPAGILQGLFFDPAADPAANYGGIGLVMGHELSHIFDDKGSQFDETGALNDWWQPEDYKRFKTATDALAIQYDGYRPLPDIHVNGRLTLGENIGDLAGLAVAYDAYHASLKGKPAPVIDGLTGDQRFFLGFAQTWRTKQRENALRQKVATDPHSPSEYRTMTVRNLDAWYEAFNVKPNHRMYLPSAERVRVW